ncbi:MAG TPA: cation transporter [Elusimicrobia bacterium]|nr:cation transporter [Elusimicrobiota bacterium]
MPETHRYYDCEGTGEEHEHGPQSLKPLAYAFSLTALIFLAEVAGGFWTGSLALLSDAAHMAVDVAAIGLGLFAAWASALPPDKERTFGYRRVEVLAALINGLALWVVVGMILHEAYERFRSPVPVEHLGGMLAIAAVGLLCNLASGALLYHKHEHSLNHKAVFLHVLSDALGSIGAIGAGLVMWKTGWWLADPLASLFICAIILAASYRLVKESIHILLEGAPSHLKVEEIRSALLGIEGVAGVHDLHLWSLSTGAPSMSGHVVLKAGGSAKAVLKESAKALEEKFCLKHVTLQVEHPD